MTAPRTTQSHANNPPAPTQTQLALTLHCQKCRALRTFVGTLALERLMQRQTQHLAYESVCEYCHTRLGVTLAWVEEWRWRTEHLRAPLADDCTSVEEERGMRLNDVPRDTVVYTKNGVTVRTSNPNSPYYGEEQGLLWIYDATSRDYPWSFYDFGSVEAARDAMRRAREMPLAAFDTWATKTCLALRRGLPLAGAWQHTTPEARP